MSWKLESGVSKCKQLFLGQYTREQRNGAVSRRICGVKGRFWFCYLLILWWELLERVCLLREMSQYRGKRETNREEGVEIWSRRKGRLCEEERLDPPLWLERSRRGFQIVSRDWFGLLVVERWEVFPGDFWFLNAAWGGSSAEVERMWKYVEIEDVRKQLYQKTGNPTY